MAGPPMSMFSTHSANALPFATVASNGYRLTTRRSIAAMPCASIAARWPGFSRVASRPPCTFGSSLLPRRGWVGMHEAPAHARHLPGAAVDHQLGRAAGSLASGEIDALLELNRILEGTEGPHLAVGQHQHRTVAVGQPVRLDGRVQMEAHRKCIAAAGRQLVAVRRQKPVLAVEAAAVRGEPQRALVHDAESARVAVLRRTHLD